LDLTLADSEHLRGDGLPWNKLLSVEIFLGTDLLSMESLVNFESLGVFGFFESMGIYLHVSHLSACCVKISDLSILLSGLRRRLESMTQVVTRTVNIS